ncbi:hypothetical protein ABTY59_32145 [Streptomyces sp. NPDC096079]|uniref:hypothetical protein n=1 Tax=Streptomyces sp. NPDC096079 TaxID=3155820 RepID=UPI00331EB343
MTFNPEITLGDILATALTLAALGYALWQGIGARRDLIAERRADFYLGELMTISIAMGADPIEQARTQDIRLRLKILPEDYLPVLRRIADSPHTLQWLDAERMGEPGLTSSMQLRDYARKRITDDISEAVDHALGKRPTV